MRVKLKTGTIAKSDNPFVIEQWTKAGLRDLDAVKNKPKPEIREDAVPAKDPEPEQKPKKTKRSRKKASEPLPPDPKEAENILKVMPKPEGEAAQILEADDEPIKRPGEI